MSPYHAPFWSLCEWPFWHVPTLSIDHDQAQRDICESLRIVEEDPRHLGAVNIPEGHISIDIVHVGWYFAGRPVIFE